MSRTLRALRLLVLPAFLTLALGAGCASDPGTPPMPPVFPGAAPKAEPASAPAPAPAPEAALPTEVPAPETAGPGPAPEAPAVPAPAASEDPASRERLRQDIQAVLAAHPELVLDVLDRNKVAVFEIVEKGVRLKQEQARRDQILETMKNPLTPEVDPSRPMLGAPEAPVTIVEYSDFLCPFCAKAAQTVKDLVARHPGRVRVFFKHLPLHEASRETALYFEAAGLQSPELAWQFHDQAFARMKELAERKGAVLEEIAAGLPLDRERLAQDMATPELARRLEQDEAEARRFNLSGTPMFLVNGVLLRGAVPAEAFEEVMGLLDQAPGR